MFSLLVEDQRKGALSQGRTPSSLGGATPEPGGIREKASLGRQQPRRQAGEPGSCVNCSCDYTNHSPFGKALAQSSWQAFCGPMPLPRERILISEAEKSVLRATGTCSPVLGGERAHSACKIASDCPQLPSLTARLLQKLVPTDVNLL